MSTIRFLFFILFFTIIAGFTPVAAAETAAADKKPGIVHEIVAKLLKFPGSNPAQKFVPKPWTATSTTGYDIAIPGTDLRVMTFFTRDTGPEVWHVAVVVDTTKHKALLSEVYQDLTRHLGVPELTSLVLIVSEKDGVARLNDLCADLTRPLEAFRDADRLNRVRDVVSLKAGVNFFATMNPPKSGPLQLLSRILLAGGTIREGSLALSGMLNCNILARLINGCQAEDKGTPPLQGLGLKIGFPPVTPLPFSLLPAEESKKAIYAELGPTTIWFSWDKAENKFTVAGNRQTSLWLVGQQLDVREQLIVNLQDQKGKTDWDIISDGSIDISKNPIRIHQGILAIHGVNLHGELRDTVVDKAEGGKKTEDAGAAFTVGVKCDLLGQKDIDGKVTIGVAKNENGTHLSEVGFSLTNEIPFASIPIVKEIPIVKDFVLREVSFGLGFTHGAIPDIYLAGALKWKDFEGEAALMLSELKGHPGFLCITRIKDFSLDQLLDLLAVLPGIDAFKSQAAEMFSAFKIPHMVVMFSSIDNGSGATGTPLLLSDLPPRMQILFDDIIKESTGQIPILADGVSLLGAMNLDFINKLIKSDVMTTVFETFGLKDQMKDAAVDNPLIFAASIGGLRKGALQAGLSVQLPVFKMPGTLRPLSYFIQPKAGTASFFIRLDLIGMTLQSGIRGQLDIKIPQFGQDKAGDLLNLGGEIYVNVDAISEGVRAGVFCDGIWHNPLGFGNINLTDTALVFGVDSNQSFELGAGGGLQIVLPERKTSPFPSLLKPAESLAYLKDLQRGKGNKSAAIAKALSSPSTLKPAETLKYGMGAMISVTMLGDEIPLPTKLAFFYQADRGYDLISALEIYDVLLRGVLAGPAAAAILDGCHTVMKATHVPDADKIFGVMKEVQQEYAKSPTLVDLFHLRDLPLFLLEQDDSLFYFGTPGAVLPGFPGIDGLGFKLIGKLSLIMFGKHELGAVDIEMTLEKGFKIYAELGDLNLVFLSIKDVKIDILAGIPKLHGDPHFLITGKTAFMFFERDVTIDLSEKGILLRGEDDFGPFAKGQIEFTSIMKEGKTIRDRDGLQDFTFGIKFEKKAIQEVLKSLLLAGLLDKVSNDLQEAQVALVRAKLRVLNVNRQIMVEREKARERIRNSKEIARKTAHELIDKLEGWKRDLDNKRKNLDLLEKWRWPLYTAAMGVLDLDIAAARKITEEAEKVVDKIQIPVDSDPHVWPLLAERTLGLVALKAADVLVQAMVKLNDKARDEIDKVLSNKLLHDQVVINDFEVFSNSLKNVRMAAKVDMTIAGKTIKQAWGVDAGSIKAMIKDLSLGLVRTILTGDSGEFSGEMSQLKQNYTEGALKAGASFDESEYALPTGGPAGAAPTTDEHAAELKKRHEMAINLIKIRAEKLQQIIADKIKSAPVKIEGTDFGEILNR